MNTQVTQKKVLKLRSTPGANAPADSEEAAAAPETMQSPPELVVVRSESFTWAAIVSVVAAVCFVVLLVVQWMEFQDLSAAFPMKQAVAAAQ
jgi:hypothetical protein